MKYCRGSIFPIIIVIVTVLTLVGSSMANGGLAAEQSEQMDAAQRGALDPLAPDEESSAERIARSDNRIKEIVGEREVRLVSATPVLIKTGESLEKIDVHQRVIEVVLFRPEGEVGARALVNLAQNSVANVERLDSRHVPFTPDDLKDAFQLALREPQVQRALGPEAQTFHIQGQRNAPPAEASEHVVSGLPIRCSAGSAASDGMLQSKPRRPDIPYQRSGDNPLAALLASGCGEWFGHSLGILSYLTDEALAVCVVGWTFLRNLCPLPHRKSALLRRRIWFRIDAHWLSRLPGGSGRNGACRQRLQGSA